MRAGARRDIAIASSTPKPLACLIAHWAWIACAGAALFVAWILLGSPGAEPDEVEQQLVHGALQTALHADGDRSGALVDRLVRECGLSGRVAPAIAQLALEPRAWLADSSRGHALVQLRAAEAVCEAAIDFRFAWYQDTAQAVVVRGRVLNDLRRARISELSSQPAVRRSPDR